MRIVVTLLLATYSLLCQGQTSISVSLNVADKKGKTIPFAITDLAISANDEPVESARLVAMGADPRVFAIMVDVSGSNRDKMAFLRKYAVDVHTVMTASGSEGILCVFAEDVSCTKAYISASDIERNLKQIQPTGGTALFDSLLATSETLARIAPERQRIIVVLTDGADNASKSTLKAALQVALRSRIVIFPIALFSQPKKRDRENVRDIARRTGTRELTFDQSGNVKKQFEEVWTNQFLLSFEWPTTPERIVVKPKSDSIIVWSVATQPSPSDTTQRRN